MLLLTIANWNEDLPNSELMKKPHGYMRNLWSRLKQIVYLAEKRLFGAGPLTLMPNYPALNLRLQVSRNDSIDTNGCIPRLNRFKASFIPLNFKF